MLAVNIVNNKVVDNLLILLVSKFHGNRLNGLRVIAVIIWSPEMLILRKFWIYLGSLSILTSIMVESPFGD